MFERGRERKGLKKTKKTKKTKTKQNKQDSNLRLEFLLLEDFLYLGVDGNLMKRKFCFVLILF